MPVILTFANSRWLPSIAKKKRGGDFWSSLRPTCRRLALDGCNLITRAPVVACTVQPEASADDLTDALADWSVMPYKTPTENLRGFRSASLRARVNASSLLQAATMQTHQMRWAITHSHVPSISFSPKASYDSSRWSPGFDHRCIQGRTEDWLQTVSGWQGLELFQAG